jgi:hypothetical protein
MPNSYVLTSYCGNTPVQLGLNREANVMMAGRVRSREQGSRTVFVTWCAKVGDTLLNNTTDKREIISHVLIPDEVIGLPDKEVLGIEWPAERLGQPEERITLGGNPE